MRGEFRLARKLNLIFSAVLVIILCGCAHDIEVNLPKAIAMPLNSPIDAGKALTLVRPRDVRDHPEVLGNLQGFTLCATVLIVGPCDPAIARLSGNVNEWIGDAFAGGLEQEGFRVARADTLSEAPTALAVQLTVMQLSTEADDTTIAVSAEAFLDRRPLFLRRYSGVSKIGPGTSPVDYQKDLQAALQNLIDQAVPNLSEALSRADR